MFGPDPGNAAVTTIGGHDRPQRLGQPVSAARRGPRPGRGGAGRARRRQVVELVPHGHRGGERARRRPTRRHGWPPGVAAILADPRPVIARWQPADRPTHGGYRLDDLERDGLVDLPRLLCGAAGTLAIVTEATLRDGAGRRRPTAVALVLFDSLEKAAEAALRLLRAWGRAPATCSTSGTWRSPAARR